MCPLTEIRIREPPSIGAARRAQRRARPSRKGPPGPERALPHSDKQRRPRIRHRRHHRGKRRDAGTDARHRVESTLVGLNARVVEGSMQGREATGRTGRLFSFWRRDVRYCAREIPRRVAPNPTDASCRRAPARPQTRSPRRPSGTRSESSARVLDAGVRGHLHDPHR